MTSQAPKKEKTLDLTAPRRPEIHFPLRFLMAKDGLVLRDAFGKANQMWKLSYETELQGPTNRSDYLYDLVLEGSRTHTIAGYRY